MIPKEKAEELINKYLKLTDVNYSHKTILLNPTEAIECALITVDEIISICTQTHFIDFWNEVKQEIENYDNI